MTMHKFTFKKISSDRVEGIPGLEDAKQELNLSQIRANQGRAEANKERRERRNRSEARRREMRKPYGIFHGDPAALLNGNPLDRSTISFIHRSLPQFKSRRDANGRLKIHQMKEWLSHKNSGYTSVTIPRESYEHHPDWAKLAPNGLEVFVPNERAGNAKSSLTRAVRDLRRIADMRSVRTSLRSATGDAPTVDELDPDHPLNVLRDRGAAAVWSRIFTDRDQSARSRRLDDEAKLQTCVCGKSADAHGTVEEAVAHHAATGQHMPIHKFTPQYVLDGDDNVVLGSKFRADQSQLRYSSAPSDRGDDYRTAKYRFKRADEGLDGTSMPVVRVGLNSGRVTKVVLRGTGYDSKGKRISPVINRKMKTEGRFEKCKGDGVNPCFGGFQSMSRTVNVIPCDTCSPGETLYSEDGSREIGVGLGNGRIKISNQEDCPDCKSCGGDGFTMQNNKSDSVKIDCRSCRATGKDLTAMGSTGAQCTNCNSKDSTVSLTTDNYCKHCHGFGVMPTRVAITRKLPKEVLARDVEHHDGNPIMLTPFDASGYGPSHIDGWKAHGDENCTQCQGDDEFQETDDQGNVTPCKNCRIGSFDDRSSLIAPKGKRFVHPDGVDAPEISYQLAMASTYKDNPENNPHERWTDFQNIDPATSLPHAGISEEGEPLLSYISDRRDIPRNNLVGVYQSGVNLGDGILKELRDRSTKHRASRNAEFCAGSAELEDIHELLGKHFPELQISTPGVRVTPPKSRVQTNGDIDLSGLHPRVQEAYPKIMERMQQIGIHPSTLHEDIAPALESASQLEHIRDKGESDDKLFSKYEGQLSKVISNIAGRAYTTTESGEPLMDFKTIAQARGALKGLPESSIMESTLLPEDNAPKMKAAPTDVKQ